MADAEALEAADAEALEAEAETLEAAADAEAAAGVAETALAAADLTGRPRLTLQDQRAARQCRRQPRRHGLRLRQAAGHRLRLRQPAWQQRRRRLTPCPLLLRDLCQLQWPWHLSLQQRRRHRLLARRLPCPAATGHRLQRLVAA